MGKLLSGLFHWIGGKLAALILILAVLLAGSWIGEESKNVAAQESLRTLLLSQRASLRTQIAELERTAGERKRQIQAATAAVQAELSTTRSALDRSRAERQAVWENNRITRNIPFTDAWKSLQVLDAKIAAYQEAVDLADRLNAAREKALANASSEIARRKLELERTGVQLAEVDASLGQGTFTRLNRLVRAQFPIAVGILLGLVLVPIGIKVFMYWVVAPWVTRRAPIRLLPATQGRVVLPAETAAGDRAGRMSAVSQSVLLGEHEVLLVQPEYLQSTSVHARKKTRWLLNPALPFASVLSGMYMLTEVASSPPEPVVLSATIDPLIEVGIVDLPEGAAFVCQPRSLAGVIQDPDNPIRISRHWRLGSLQAWLTLQLRFLVFHGPGRLVLKGCRGIRMEPARTGRLINQAATLGFSAELDYANTRCETFVSYWTGKEDLFNDLFTGESGVFVYEELPALKRTTGITGRGLEGLSDAVLKVFGV